MPEITTDPYTDTNAWSQTLQLAHQCGLTVHDAAYLELALRRRLPLATLDEKLCAGARTCVGAAQRRRRLRAGGLRDKQRTALVAPPIPLPLSVALRYARAAPLPAGELHRPRQIRARDRR
jgi:hypothetical protein